MRVIDNPHVSAKSLYSHDKTVEIVKGFMLENPELDIQIIEEDKRLGKSNAVNARAEIAHAMLNELHIKEVMWNGNRKNS